MSDLNFKDIEVFDGLSFDSLLKKIHDNSETKSKTIMNLINQVSDKINDPNSATLLVPLIAEYLNISVKNDEQLIKLAAIIQRITKTSTSGEGDVLLTEEEKKALLESVESGNHLKAVK